jgi:hypothetical protein
MHASREDLPVETLGDGYEARVADWGDHIAYFERISGPLDYSAYYESCECPHWGYVFKGKLRFVYGDREEIISAGEAYYAPPGHKFEILEDTETIEFSPAAEYREHMEKIERNMQAVSAG